jgi:hypothetical protein
MSSGCSARGKEGARARLWGFWKVGGWLDGGLGLEIAELEGRPLVFVGGGGREGGLEARLFCRHGWVGMCVVVILRLFLVCVRVTEEKKKEIR